MDNSDRSYAEIKVDAASHKMHSAIKVLQFLTFIWLLNIYRAFTDGYTLSFWKAIQERPWVLLIAVAILLLVWGIANSSRVCAVLLTLYSGLILVSLWAEYGSIPQRDLWLILPFLAAGYATVTIFNYHAARSYYWQDKADTATRDGNTTPAPATSLINLQKKETGIPAPSPVLSPSTGTNDASASPSQEQSPAFELQLRALAKLRADNIITEEEFQAKKRKILEL